MLIKVRDLIGKALDWAVAKCEGFDLLGEDAKDEWIDCGDGRFSPSEYWAQGGPIIDREGISILRVDDEYETDDKGFCTNVRIPRWGATRGQHHDDEQYGSQGDYYGAGYSVDVSDVLYGPTPLVAAMRCYVAMKLSRNNWDLNTEAEIAIPEELC